MGSAGSLGMQFDKVVQTFALVLVPVAIGMLIRAKAPTFADRNARFFKLLSVFVLLFVIIGAILKNWQLLADNAAELLPATLAFNLLSMGVGFFVPLLLKVETRQSIAIGMEIGIHNGTLAITIALSVLQNEPLAVPAGVYSILMFFTAAAFGVLVARRVKS
jgi:BASS family bile acid:Na+ symporter